MIERAFGGREVRLSGTVMTHPARLDQARRLAALFGEAEFTVVVDPSPGKPGGSLRTALLAWRSMPADSTHHVVIQDDATTEPGFPEWAALSAARFPDCALSFFTEWSSYTSFAVRVGALAGSGWTDIADDYVPSVAMLLPSPVAWTFGHEWPTARGSALARTDDIALRNHLDRAGVRSLVAIPNIVDHLDSQSLDGNHHQGERRSACPVLSLPEAPDRLWRGPVLQWPTMIPYFSGTSDQALCLWWDGQSRSWRRTDMHTSLAEMGLAELLDVPYCVLAADGSPSMETGTAGREALRNLLTVAGCIGFVAVRCAGAPISVNRAERVTEAAIMSLGGCLRHHVRPGALDKHLVTLQSLLCAAVEQGAAQADRFAGADLQP